MGDAVARGLDDYYAGTGDLPGRWMGRGAERLGLSGELDGDALDDILDGRDPTTGSRVTAETPKVIGYDATFCAPKSVSLLYALGPPEIASEVRAAHDAAVDAAFAVYESVACRVRREHGGATVIEADGFVAAAYQHRSSRAGDPDLHTNVLWGPVHNGIADIATVPRRVIDAFSRRRAQIEAHLQESGRSTARAAQFASYATRRPKDRDTLPDDLFAEWRARAGKMGMTRSTVAGWTGRGREVPEPSERWTEELFTWLAGPCRYRVVGCALAWREPCNYADPAALEPQPQPAPETPVGIIPVSA